MIFMSETKSDVLILKTDDRSKGITRLLDEFGLNSYNDKSVAIKANYNSADPFPASTHIQTLKLLIENLQNAGVSSITLAERSGMGDTRQVLDEMGVTSLSSELGFNTIILDEEDADAWVKINGENNHWLHGFYISKLFQEADKVVQTCCLKTHRFGGNFTLSLKNSVGLIAKKVPGSFYDYMGELHVSPYQRRMIAEINSHYETDLILMDGMKAFLNMGPEKGLTIEPNLLLASHDRVAIDAVGVAILRYYGTTNKVMTGRIFEQAQIRRAAELKIGVNSAKNINLIPLNDETEEQAENITYLLNKQG